MIDLLQYNPCKEESIRINRKLERITEICSISVKFNDSLFITNIQGRDISLGKLKKEYSFNEKGYLQIKSEWGFYKKNIKKVPKVKLYLIEDYELSGIVKSMYAQIEFGFVSYRSPEKSNIKLISFVFKSLFSKSNSIKKKNIDMALAEYNRQKIGNKTSIYIIRAIIYMVYEYYNSAFS